MPKAYHITQWSRLYEKSDTRKTDYMSWYAKQTKLTGIGIGLTLQQPAPRNLILLGTWALIETLASLSAAHHRGWLVRDGAPMTPEDMSALIPTVPAEHFQEALKWFSQGRINWVEHAEFSPANLPVNQPQRDRTGNAPGSSPANLPVNSETRSGTRGNSATDRQTDSTQTDRQRSERERERDGANASSPKAVEASKAQAGALLARIATLERRKQELTPPERAELRKKKRALVQIQEQQGNGDFSLVQTSEPPPP
jgi:hypothetical protein